MNHFFEQIYREAKVDRIKKFINLTDNQKDEAAEFFKSHTTGYDSYIDWQHPEKVYWSDFEKVFDLANNSKSKQRKNKFEYIKSENPLYELFSRDDVLIHGEDDNFIFVSPLSYEASVWMDSVECGGAGAQWCIGYSQDDIHWLSYLSKGYAFILAFRKDFLSMSQDDRSVDLKYMIQLNPFIADYSGTDSTTGAVWNQQDKAIIDICTDGELNIRGRDISIPNMIDYAHAFWKNIRKYTDLSDVECRLIDENENEYNIFDLILATSAYNNARKKIRSIIGDTDDDKEDELFREIAYEIGVYNEWNLRVKYLFEGKSVIDVVNSFDESIGDAVSEAISNDQYIKSIIEHFIDDIKVNFDSARVSKDLEDINGIPFGINFKNTPLREPIVEPITSINDVFSNGKFTNAKYTILVVNYQTYIKYNYYFAVSRPRFYLTNVPDNMDLNPKDIGVCGFYNVNLRSLSIRVSDQHMQFNNCKIDNLTVSGSNSCNMYNSNIGILNVISPFAMNMTIVDSSIDTITNYAINNIALIDSTTPIEKAENFNHAILGGKSIKYIYQLKNIAKSISIFNRKIEKYSGLRLSDKVRNDEEYLKYIKQYMSLNERDEDLDVLLGDY